MNPIESLISTFQHLAAQVPEILQPFVVALAGTVPFIEGELSSMIGVWSGMNPIVAGLAGATGNFISVLLVVVFGTRLRSALIARRARVRVGPGAAETKPAKPESKGRARLRRYLVRFGVPGASLLGPLALPTQFTGATLVASGVRREWVLLWQAIAIVLWTTVTTMIATGVLTLVR